MNKKKKIQEVASSAHLFSSLIWASSSGVKSFGILNVFLTSSGDLSIFKKINIKIIYIQLLTFY